jgi:hypothetical protein
VRRFAKKLTKHYKNKTLAKPVLELVLVDWWNLLKVLSIFLNAENVATIAG